MFTHTVKLEVHLFFRWNHSTLEAEWTHLVGEVSHA
jgi:hypothetical protein